MNEKYIAKSELDLALKSLCKKYNISYGGESMGFGRELAEISDRLTAADVCPKKRGKWLILDDTNTSVRWCSECGDRYTLKDHWLSHTPKFCHNCGAENGEDEWTVE